MKPIRTTPLRPVPPKRRCPDGSAAGTRSWRSSAISPPDASRLGTSSGERHLRLDLAAKRSHVRVAAGHERRRVVFGKLFGRAPAEARGEVRPPPAVPEGLRLYVVGDVHGRFDLLTSLRDLVACDLAGF